MPHQSCGDASAAAQLEEHNNRILNDSGAEAIVTDCAACGHVLKGYTGLQAPVYDVNEYLVDALGVAAPESKVKLKVTYHDPLA